MGQVLASDTSFSVTSEVAPENSFDFASWQKSGLTVNKFLPFLVSLLFASNCNGAQN